jgi:hypothetical protein
MEKFPLVARCIFIYHSKKLSVKQALSPKKEQKNGQNQAGDQGGAQDKKCYAVKPPLLAARQPSQTDESDKTNAPADGRRQQQQGMGKEERKYCYKQTQQR